MSHFLHGTPIKITLGLKYQVWMWQNEQTCDLNIVYVMYIAYTKHFKTLEWNVSQYLKNVLF